MDNKRINMVMFLLLSGVSCLSFSETFAKLTCKFSNIAWITNFTDLLLIDDVFIIEDVKDSSGKKYGVEESVRIPSTSEYEDLTDEEYQKIVEEIKKYNSSADIPENKPDYTTFQNLVNDIFSGEENVGGSKDITVTGGGNNYDGYYYVPQSTFEEMIGSDSATNFQTKNQYSIANVGTRGFVVSNYTEEPLLVVFDVYYYAPKSDSSSSSISCGLYNVSLHGDNLDLSSDNMMKTEFLSKYTKKEGGFLGFGGTEHTYYYYFMNEVANVESSRIGDGKQVVQGYNNYHYPYHVHINPYAVKKDPDLLSVYQGYESGNSNVHFNGFMSTNNFSLGDVDLKYNLRDFIIPADKKNYIFNLSFYCGNKFGVVNSSGLSYAFLAGIEMSAIPITDGGEIDLWLQANEPID